MRLQALLSWVRGIIVLMFFGLVSWLPGEAPADEPAALALSPWAEASVLAALRDPSPPVRAAALAWLGDKQTSNLELAQAVASAVRPELPPEAKQGAAQVLQRMGPAAARWAPRLVPLLDDPVNEVRHAASNALVNMGPAAAAAVAPPVAALRARLENLAACGLLPVEAGAVDRGERWRVDGGGDRG